MFPVDFVVLDMKEDKDIPLILGRPFLATGRALIDVENGELTFRMNDESRTFTIYKALKIFEDNEPNVMEECKTLELVHSCSNTNGLEEAIDPLEYHFSNSSSSSLFELKDNSNAFNEISLECSNFADQIHEILRGRTQNIEKENENIKFGGAHKLKAKPSPERKKYESEWSPDKLKELFVIPWANN